MLRFIESKHGFKDGLYILFHQSIMGWIFDFIIIGLLALSIWYLVKSIRERKTYGILTIMLIGVLILFTILLIKPMNVMMSNVGHYEGDTKVSKINKVTYEGDKYYALSNKKSEVRSQYVVLVPLSTVDKGKVKKGDTVYVKTHPSLQVKKGVQVFNSTGDNIEFKVK